MIIGNIWKKEDTVRSCCLTCRAWLHAGRTVLYESVTLGPDRADLRLFFEAFQSSPILATYVREFVLAFDEDKEEKEVEFTTEELDMLQFILTKAEHLRRLGFYGSVGTISWPDAATFQLPRMELVCQLEVVNVCFPNTESLILFFVSSLPNVQSITAAAVSVSSATGRPVPIVFPDVPGADPVSVMPCLQSLMLAYFDKEPYRLLLASQARTVDVLFSCKADISLFCSLFRVSSTAASVLDLSLLSHILVPLSGEPSY